MSKTKEIESLIPQEVLDAISAVSAYQEFEAASKVLEVLDSLDAAFDQNLIVGYGLQRTTQ